MQKHRFIQGIGLLAGILFIIGFIFPIMLPFSKNGWLFPNIELLSDLDVPFSGKAYLLFPILGATMCFIALGRGQQLSRAILYLAAGYIPWLFELALSAEVLAASNFGFGAASRGFFSTSAIVSYMFSFGITALVAGAFTGSVYKGNKLAPYFGMAGGILVGLSLIVPVNLPGEGWSIFLFLPVQALFESPLMGIALLILLASIVPACIFAILWGMRHKTGVDHSMRIRQLLIFGFLWTSIMLLVSVFAQSTGRAGNSDFMIMATTIYIKGICMFTAPFLAKCLGIIELLGHFGGSGEPGDSVKLHPSPDSNPNPFDNPNELPF